MSFLNPSLIKILRRSREKFYDDVLQLYAMSGVQDTGSPKNWTLPDGSQVPDAWGRTELDKTRQGVVAKKILVSGNFTWLPVADRNFQQIGMVEGAEAAFACSDEFYPVISGARMWSVMDEQQLRVIRISKAESTGEIVLILGKTRDDF
jgi:hypothetical protein